MIPIIGRRLYCFIMKYFNKIKCHISLVSFLIVFIISTIIFIILGIEPFGKNSILVGDSYDQYLPFYYLFRDKIISGDIFCIHNFSYSWKVGLGTNFLLLFFYYLSAPFNLLLPFVSSDSIPGLISIFVIIKISVAAASFSYYISNRKRTVSYGWIVVLSIAYSMSGFICGYFWNIMWLDCIAIFPIIVYGLDDIIDKNKPIIYILSLFLSIYLNFYMSFMICLFLVLYFIIKVNKTKVDIISKGTTFFLSSLLAGGMSAVSLFVIYYGINNTMTAGASMPSFGIFGSFFYTLRQIFFLTKPIVVDRSGYDGYANLYIGVSCILLFLIYFCSNAVPIFEKIKNLIIVLVLVFSMNEAFLNFIWHGFHKQFLLPNRFSFILIFIILCISYDSIIALKETSIKNIVIAVLMAVLTPILFYCFVDFDGYISSNKLVLINLYLIILYGTIILLINCLKKYRGALIKLIAVLVIFEISYNFYFSIEDNRFYKDTSSLDKLELLINDNDDGYYRSEILNPVITNENTLLGLRGISVFCSTIYGDSIYTLVDLGLQGFSNEYKYQESISCVDALLGLKNIYYMDENDEPNIYRNDNTPALGFVVNDSILQYRPEDSHDFGRNINNIAQYSYGISEYIFDNVSQDVSIFTSNCMLSDEDVSYSQIKTLDSDAIVDYRYDVNKDGIYYFYLSASAYDNIDIFINNSLYATGEISGGAIALNYLTVGDVVDVYLYTSQDIPVEWYMYRYDSIVADQYNSCLLDKETNIRSFEEGKLEVSAHTDNNEIVMLSIPYDRGWRVYDNGNRVETVPVIRGFTGIMVDGEGEHTLELVYMPEGFIIGVIVTIISWIIFIIYVVKYRKKLKYSKEDTAYEA